MDKCNIGIDIGGTKVNIGLVNDAGQIIGKINIATQKELSARQNVKNIVSNLHALLVKFNRTLDDINFIGVGVPGTVNSDNGIVDYCPNLAWVDEPIGSYFEEYLGLPVRVMQDTRNAAWAEWLFGAGKGLESLICLTIGTGIGCGIILDRKIFKGSMNTAGEIGHSILYKNGRPCVCGNYGCLERYASGTGILERALEIMPDKFIDRERKSETVFQLAYECYQPAITLIEQCADDLGLGIVNTVNILSPQAVIISGGLCVHNELFVHPLICAIEKYAYFSWKRKHELKIYQATLGSDAPMIGAASLNLN